MSTNVNNIFNFSRSLPEPFDKLANKKIKVSSKYGNGTEATLCATVIKAVHAVCRCMNGTGEGAVGIIDNRYVAEYKSAAGPDAYHIVVYNSDNGYVTASVYDKNTEIIETYLLNASGRDGAAVMMAAFPALMNDDEFKSTYQAYYDEFLKGYPDLNTATEYMAILCDNVYRRVKDDTCTAHVKISVDKSGNMMRISQTQLDSGAFTPTSVIAGEFTIFAKTGPAKIVKAASIVEHKDFVGKYVLSNRRLSAAEQSMVPVLPEWYIIPKEVVDICKHAQKTTGKPTQMRNFLLRGPSGTGKTMDAKAVAAGVGRPYLKYTCGSDTEIISLLGMFYPETEVTTTGDASLDAERESLMKMGGINYANVAKLMNLPDLDDMDYDPAGVYQALTGVENTAATSQDCMGIVLDRVTEKVRELSKEVKTENNSGQTYRYIETDFIRALKNGYVVEIQEPSTIAHPGVLVGLNSLLEQSGSITLATGEVIERHPDAVVIVTTNTDYEGCRSMNQSVIDRMSLIYDVETPSPEVMVQRAMSVTGATDEYQVSKMVQVVNDLAHFCKQNSITDGSYGMRSLIDWIVSAEITGDVYEAAKNTIISKATADENDRAALINTILDPIFAPRRKSGVA